ncbi:MAG: DUF2190 family protein [Planctomycetaceae bacterium]|nr:DUF2190 family protein [Planctomycetaceae bacterium]
MGVYGEFKKKRRFTEPGFEHTRSADTPANTVIVVGGLVGVTTEFTPAGKMFWVPEQGTFEITNTAYSALTFAKGDTVKMTVASEIGTIATAGTIILGHAAVAKVAGVETVVVRLATGRNG